jgi:hypothetical protein
MSVFSDIDTPSEPPPFAGVESGESVGPVGDPPELKACACGCGGTTNTPTARYLPGHHRRGKTVGPKAPSRRTQARSAGAEKGREIDRVAGLIGVVQLPATLLVLAGKQSDNKALIADGVVLSHHAPELSKALVDLADENDVVDRAINAVLAAGPYAQIAGILVPLSLQLAANHGAAPVLPAMGTISVDDVLRAAGLEASDDGPERRASTTDVH